MGSGAVQNPNLCSNCSLLYTVFFLLSRGFFNFWQYLRQIYVLEYFFFLAVFGGKFCEQVHRPYNTVCRYAVRDTDMTRTAKIISRDKEQIIFFCALTKFHHEMTFTEVMAEKNDAPKVLFSKHFGVLILFFLS